MYYVYVLHSKRDDGFYYGYSQNLTQRFDDHLKGRVESTKARRPLKLIYYEACINKSDALNREQYFKSYRGRQFLQNRLKSYFTGLNS
jgi:putative endonuclease